MTGPMRTHIWQNGKEEKKTLLHPKLGKQVVYRRLDVCVDCGLELRHQRKGTGGHYKLDGLGKIKTTSIPVCPQWDPSIDTGNTEQHTFLYACAHWQEGTPEELERHKLSHGQFRYIRCECGLVRKDVKGSHTPNSSRYICYYGSDLSRVCPPCPDYMERMLEDKKLTENY